MKGEMGLCLCFVSRVVPALDGSDHHQCVSDGSLQRFVGRFFRKEGSKEGRRNKKPALREREKKTSLQKNHLQRERKVHSKENANPAQ